MSGSVVVVEDDKLLAWAVTAQLEDLHYVVAGTAATAEEAVDTVLRLQPAIVLMDIHLEGQRSGLDAAREIRTKSDVPILFCTAFAELPGIAEQVAAIGNTGLVGKPATDEQLDQGLRRLLSPERPS